MSPDCAQIQPLLPAGERCVGVSPLAGDGSARSYYRVLTDRGSYALCVGPDPVENAAVVRLSRHLSSRGVPVPRVHGSDAGRGWLLQDDLGDRNLLVARRECTTEDELVSLYRPVLAALCRLQLDGAVGYDPALGHFPSPYGVGIMVEEEGMYFAREFAEGLLGLPVPAAFRSEVERLAAWGARAPGAYLLHRDFQSRNIHLTPAGPAVIDFQGCRPGPLAYDVAALVLDPYAALPAGVRGRLLVEYRGLLTARGVAPDHFELGWFAVGAFRLLQALGAFAKLGGRFGKPGFLEHAAVGLAHLQEHLGEVGRTEFAQVSEVVEQASAAWAKHPRAGAGR